jgi:hypothetical protein
VSASQSALLDVPHVRITIMSVPADALLSPRTDSQEPRAEDQIRRVCGASSPWSLRKVEVAAVHRSACWDDIEEMRSNSVALPPSLSVQGDSECAAKPDATLTEVAVLMMCDGRWPQRLLRPMLDSIVVDPSSATDSKRPEALAVFSDSSVQRLQMEIRLLDLQCSHVCSKKSNHAIGTERDRESLRGVVERWGTLHCVQDGTRSGRVLLPARFSERLLVLAALIRAQSDKPSAVATPGPWVDNLVHTWLHKMMEICNIDAERGRVQWLDEASSYAAFGLHAEHFSEQSLFFNAIEFDAMSRHGPGAAERLVSSMSRLGIISMQVFHVFARCCFHCAARSPDTPDSSKSALE